VKSRKVFPFTVAGKDCGVCKSYNAFMIKKNDTQFKELKSERAKVDQQAHWEKDRIQ
jgi:hypothetical protein